MTLVGQLLFLLNFEGHSCSHTLVTCTLDEQSKQTQASKAKVWCEHIIQEQNKHQQFFFLSACI